MTRLFTFFTIILFVSVNLTAQSTLNVELIKKTQSLSDNEQVNVLLLKKNNTDLDLSAYGDVKIHYTSGDIFSITASLKSIKKLANDRRILRMESVQHHIQLMADTCVVRNRIKNVRLGTAPLTQAYDGTGVIVGIIDSGTDFSHPDFKDASGNSRIKFLWDMTKPVDVNTPMLFGYGQEWNNYEIDLGQCTHNDLAHSGHGTASSGIAAGNGLSINHYEGIAPKADIMVVAVDFSRPGFTIADAVSYLINKAQLIGKPIVINASLGDYYGSHDGTDLETQMINNLITASPGRAMVASAGNAGDEFFHVGYNITSIDTNFTWIKRASSVINLSEYADTNQIKNVKYSVGVNNPAYTNLGNTSFKAYNYALNTVKRDTIYHNSNRIGIVESVASINTFGVYELEITIKADSLNYLWRIEHTGTGRIDSWNFDYVSSGLPTLAQYPKMNKFKKADTLQTIVSGFQCSNEVIAVANYVNRNQYVDYNNNTQITTETPGQISASSSIGPSRDNKIKPDVAATGSTILTTMALGMKANLIANAPQVVAQGGYHLTVGGTSAASPVVAGLVALYLQKNPTATNQQVRQAIINCTYSDVFTSALPNPHWGNGKLDGFAAMTCSVATNIKEIEDRSGMSIFPNPLVSETTILFENSNFKKIKLYNATGQLVFADECSDSTYVFKKQNLASGIYLLTSEEKNATNRVKLLIL